MKRLLALMLCVLLTIPDVLGLIPQACAAMTESEIRTAVTAEFEQLRATANPGESAYDGTFQMLSHALFGGGAQLQLDEDDYFTGLMLHSNMYREIFVESVTAAVAWLQQNFEPSLVARANGGWYEHKMSYSHWVYDDKNNDDPADNVNVIRPPKDRTPYTGPINAFDEGLILVGGNVDSRVRMRRVESANNALVYRFQVEIFDEFDFTTEYESSDATLAKALTWFGKLLQLGAVVNTYSWRIDLEFEMTFSNDCDHLSKNCQWDFLDRVPTAVEGQGLVKNPVTVVTGVSEKTGEELEPYFALEKKMTLYHDNPWVVEFTMKGGYPFYLGPGRSYADGEPYLLKSAEHMMGGHGYRYTERVDGEEKTRIGRKQYGVRFDSFGYTESKMHTYRLENRIAADGSNMVYLVVDGQQIGALDHYFINNDSVNVDQNQKVDWFSGLDLQVAYLFNSSFRFRPFQTLGYVRIWETGEENPVTDYYRPQKEAPTCTGKGYTAHICALCGDTKIDSYIDALGHTFGAWEKKDANLHSRTCTVCGEEEVDAHSWNGEHTCTLCSARGESPIAGSWETDFTLSAAELGVSTPDARLRCTLSFGTDGTVMADWSAIDLSAFREFYHTLFVNAYYACAYGAGITDLAQVEQMCLESNGKNVSDYIYAFLDGFDINALFTPAPASGTYRTEGGNLYTDLPLLGSSSDEKVPNPMALEGSLLKITAASYGQSGYTLVCSRK